MKQAEKTLASTSSYSLNEILCDKVAIINYLFFTYFYNFSTHQIIELITNQSLDQSIYQMRSDLQNELQKLDLLLKTKSPFQDTKHSQLKKEQVFTLIQYCLMIQDIKFSTQYSYRIKLLVLGAKCIYVQSGKSSLIYTYKHDAPPLHKISSQQTDAIIKKIKYIKANKEGSEKLHYQCNIHLWDTTADESLDILDTILLKRVNGIILVFDRQSKSSFEKMKIIWSKIQEKRKKLYHVELVLIGNVRQKNMYSPNKELNQQFFTSSVRQGIFGSNRKKMNSLLEDDYVRPQRNDIVLEDNVNKSSKYRKNSFRKTVLDSPEDYEDFTHDIKAFKDSEECDYYEISVHSPESVRQVFQKLIGKVMKNIEEGKINIQDVVIKDTQGKIKLRKFDFKTYEYFEKRYNKCC